MNLGFTLALGFSLFSVYAVNTILSSLLPSIQREFVLTPLIAGLVTSAYGWSYAAMQIPVGIMSNRVEPRRIIAFSMLFYFLSTIWFSVSNGEILVETWKGRKQEGVVYLTERIHPEVIASTQHKINRGIDFNYLAT